MELTCFGFLVFFKCSSAQGLANQARFCDVADPIRMSHQDTRSTKEQVDRYDRTGKRLCGWGKR